LLRWRDRSGSAGNITVFPGSTSLNWPAPIASATTLNWRETSLNVWSILGFTTPGQVGTPEAPAKLPAAIALNTDSLVLDDTSFTLVQANYQGTAWTWTAGPDDMREIGGGSVTISNLQWNVGQGTIWGSVSSPSGLAFSGPLFITSQAAVVTGQLLGGGLSVVQGGWMPDANARSAMMDALNLVPNGMAADAFTALPNWFTMSAQVSSVPEASTWAQLGLGLVGLAALRKRASAKAQH
jgi:hypothetical protein